MYASSIPANGTPANVIRGTKDESVLAPVIEPVESHIFEPLCFVFAPKGLGDAAHQLSGASLIKMHGSEVIENGNKYSTFNTPLVKLANELGLTIMVHRLEPDDSATSTLRLYSETFTKEIDVPQRDANGNLVYVDGKLVTAKETGLQVIWRIGKITEAEAFGAAKPLAGTNLDVDGNPSKIRPIYDVPGPYFGSYGDNFKLSFACLNSKSLTPVTAEYQTAVGSRLYRLSVREATPSNVVGNIVPTLSGSNGVTYSHAKRAKYTKTNTVYDYRYTVNQAYIDKKPAAGLPAFPGPFKQFYCYDDQFTALIEEIAAFAGVAPEFVDPFTALDLEGNPYDKVVVDSGALGGEVLNESHYHALAGGADGTMNNDVYDLLVRRELERFGSGPVHYRDMLKYPFSTFIDMGFSLETKEAMAKVMGIRPDCTVFNVPFIYNEAPNTIESESSLAVSIAGYLRAYPESQYYTTPAMRGYIVGQDYLLNDGSYLDRVPLVYHLVKLLGRYAGGTSMRSSYRFFDGGRQTIIDTGYDISLQNKENSQYEKDYANGLIYAIPFDDHRCFFPSLRSIYNDQRSVLVGMLPSLVCGDLIRVSQRVWARNTGNQTLGESEYCDVVAQDILNETNNRYDTVKKITPVVYATPADHAEGNQFTVDIYVEFNTTKTIHKVSIIAQRGGTVNEQ